MSRNKALRIGTTILSIWSIVNIAPGIGSIIYILLGKHAPVFVYLFTPSEVSNLEPRILSTTDSVALLLNTLIISYFILVFFIIKYGLRESHVWTFWVLIFTVVIAQIASYIADLYLGSPNIIVNILSTLIMTIGFSFSAYGIFSKKSE